MYVSVVQTTKIRDFESEIEESVVIMARLK